MDILEVEVCVNTQGMMRGAMDIIDQIETLNDVVDELQLTSEIQVTPVRFIEGANVDSNCPVAKVGDDIILNASAENVMAAILDKTGGEEYK